MKRGGDTFVRPMDSIPPYSISLCKLNFYLALIQQKNFFSDKYFQIDFFALNKF